MPHSAPEISLASLRRLFPGLGEEEYANLDAWYTRYTALIVRMYERITGDPKEYERFLTLTSHASCPSMAGKVDSPKETNQI
jgi:hypothetical protein